MAYSSLLYLSICFLVLFHGCRAQLEQVTGRSQRPQQQRFQTECRINNLNAQEPAQRFEAEAGLTEYWSRNDEQFRCAGVDLVRHTIQRRGLLLPSFSNAPTLIYVVQGRGLHGAAIPGCAETFQSESSSQFRGDQGSQRRGRDLHQKVRQIREGDILAVPAGIAHWIYNDGESQLILVELHDTSNQANQLDENARRFYLAGNPHGQRRRESWQGSRSTRSQSRSRSQRQQERERSPQSGSNMFNGFDEEFLAESFNIDNELAMRIQNRDDQRGRIVLVEDELRVLSPQSRGEEREERGWDRDNGVEETFCTLRLKHNIADPQRTDVYNERGGRITSLNSLNLPILRYIQLSVERGVLYRNALVAPLYNMNCHSVIYVIRGNARLQVVGENGQNVFDGEVREGQALTVPQNFAVIKKAGNQGFEWVAFKTNDNAKTNPLAGRLSVMRALPEDVLINAYRIDREEARRLKYNRDETTLFSSESFGWQRRN
ncbi:legumin B-like [Juglans microcarpa x Juglans regia]|uniref:legumin B-like n=1 Tax=Juglans microcarpa x Juglans regia TaxID=2249226 RepID=UPI001B7E339E|nr:legumin B-like [Juglans microcarpa x Juglans regia]